MDVFLQAVVVIGAVIIGVRFGSIGLGICGGGGFRASSDWRTGRRNSYYFGSCHGCFHNAGRRRD